MYLSVDDSHGKYKKSLSRQAHWAHRYLIWKSSIEENVENLIEVKLIVPEDMEVYLKQVSGNAKKNSWEK